MNLLVRTTRPALSQPPANVFYVLIDVPPIFLQAAAQIVQSRLAIARADDAVLGTLAIAGKQEIALLALAGQRMEFIETELALFLGEDHS